MFGDGAQLLIDLVEQCRDKIEGDHGLLRAWQGVTLSTNVEEVHDYDNKASKYYRVSLVCQRLTPLVTMPYLTACRASEFSLGSPLPTLHSPYHPCQALPCSTWRTQTRCCRWRVAIDI